MSRPYHEHPIFRISSVGRPVDVRYRSNAAIVALVVLAGVGGAAWGWLDPAGSLWLGGRLALAVFTVWALGRELDPDRNATAFIAVPLVIAAQVVWGAVDLWALASAIMFTRLVNRIVGPPARTTDLVVIAGLVLGALASGRWDVTVVGTVAFVLDAVLTDGRRDRLAFAAVFVAGLVTAVVSGWPAPLGFVVPTVDAATVVAAVAGVVALLYLVRSPPLRSPADLPGHTLSPARIQAGIALVVLALAVSQLVPTAERGLGLAAALLGLAIARRWLPGDPPDPS